MPQSTRSLTILRYASMPWTRPTKFSLQLGHIRLEAAVSAEEVARLALHDPSPVHRAHGHLLSKTARVLHLTFFWSRPSMFQVTRVFWAGAPHYPRLQRHLGLQTPLILQFSEVNKTLVSHFSWILVLWESLDITFLLCKFIICIDEMQTLNK